MGMTVSEVFELAAERIVLGINERCCSAIYGVDSAPNVESTAITLFEDLFRLDSENCNPYHYGSLHGAFTWSDRNNEGYLFLTTPETQLARSLALLLAAEIYRRPKRRKRR